MTTERLECPVSAGDLYLAADITEVEAGRPIMTGDVFDDISIPGLDQAGLAIILTHPCSMRRDGVRLAERLLMARVRYYQHVPFKRWESHNWKVMPLPNLNGSEHAAMFSDIGLVPSNDLLRIQRIASLTPFGINLLQQRLIWYLTRFVAPTHRLNEACDVVFEEAELCEDWVVARTGQGISLDDAETEFHDWIRGGRPETRQEALKDPQQRAGVRREMRGALEDAPVEP